MLHSTCQSASHYTSMECDDIFQWTGCCPLINSLVCVNFEIVCFNEEGNKFR